jgi:RHS repeat-associated protein
MDFLDQGNGMPNNITAFQVPLGFVNLTNGNLHQEIVFSSVPQRAHRPPVVVKAVYDSRFWQFPANGGSWWPSFMGTGGWRIVVTGIGPGGVSYDTQPFPCNDVIADTQILNFRYIDDEGYTHMFWESSGNGSVNTTVGPNCADNHPDSGYAMDGSGYFIKVTNTVTGNITSTNAIVYAPDGTQVYPQLEDSNGNYFDSLGRTPFAITTCSDNPNATCYAIPNSSGGTSTYEITWETLNVCTAFNRWGDDYCTVPTTQHGRQVPAHGTFQAIQSIILPDKTAYTFKYDSGTSPGNYGELTGVTLPTGATLDYTYSNFFDAQGGNSDFNPNRWVTSYSTGEGTWTLQPQVLASGSPGCLSNLVCDQVTITKPSNDQDVYTFSSTLEPVSTTVFTNFYNNTWNTKIQYYQGTATGNPMMTVESDYARPGYDPFPASTTVSMATPSGTVAKQTTYTYKKAGVSVMNVPKVVTEYGFGSGQVGPLLRTTSYYYLDEDASNPYQANYINRNIADRPITKVISDAGQNQVARTIYEYDRYTESITASGAMQHDSNYGTGFAVRGNLTATSVWRNTDGAYLATRNQYDDAGNITKTVDPKGNVTKFGYADSWGDTTCAPTGTGAAYLTSITDALGHITRTKYNSCTGTAASTTDANSQPTSFSYNAMEQLVQTNFPDGGETCISPSTLLNPNCPGPARPALPESTVTTRTISQTLGEVTTAVFDGLGRMSQTQVNSDPDGVTYADITYDASGRQSTASNPHRSTALSTDGISTLTYEAVDRISSITNADGSVTHTYYGLDVAAKGGIATQSSGTGLAYPTLSVDAAGNKRQKWIDAFRRVVEVDEQGGPFAGTPSSGSFNLNGTLLSQNGIGARPGTKATGTITINGSEQCKTFYAGAQGYPTQLCDTGNIYATVNGATASTPYCCQANAAGLASNLASAIVSATNYSVLAVANGNVITLTAGNAGSCCNYSFSASSTTQYPPGSNAPVTFSPPSFTTSVSGSAMTGGTDAYPGITVSDAGSVTLAAGGYTQTVAYGAATVDVRFTNDSCSGCGGTPVGGGDRNLYVTSVTLGSTTVQPGDASVSYTGAPCNSYSNGVGTLLCNGNLVFATSTAAQSITVSAYGSPDYNIYPHMQLLVNGIMVGEWDVTGTAQNYTATVSTGNTTAQLVASDLAARLSAQNPPFNVNAAGTTLSFVWKSNTTAGNIPVSASSTSNYPQYFAQGSFGGSGALAGGQNPEGSSLDHPYVTLYSYDSRGNLTCAVQKGADTTPFTGCSSAPATWRPRSFVYDSLSNLLNASSPEVGTITYGYDDNGNRAFKTDNRGVKINYNPSDSPIDPLNRVTKKEYSNGDPAVTFAYDQGTNGIGRLYSVTDASASTTFSSHDPMGRLKSEQVTIAGISKNIGYSYDLTGTLSTVTYPSGSIVTYQNNGVGRDLFAKDLSSAINYVTSATYAPDGSISGFTSGQQPGFAGVNHSSTYNSRLQPVNISASSPTQTIFSLSYDFHLGNGDNGNVWKVTNNKDTSRTQSFTYDGLDRITSAQNAGTDCSVILPGGHTKFGGNAYSYDPWGNLLQKTPTKCTAEYLNVTADAQNRIHTIPSENPSDFSYDAAGNITFDPIRALTYTYDGENRISGVAGYSYSYDGQGNRVEKSNGATGTLYWIGLPGVLAESDLSGSIQHEYVFFHGERVARRDETQGSSGVLYYFSDYLKTTDIVTDSAGNILNESDLSPWGGELQIAHNDGNHYLFTGKERDQESGLDYFGARYYRSQLGRFLSADPVNISKGKIATPQAWNLYSYGLNNPLRFVDPDGARPMNQTLLSAINNFTRTMGHEVDKEVNRRIEAKRDEIAHPDRTYLDAKRTIWYDGALNDALNGDTAGLRGFVEDDMKEGLLEQLQNWIDSDGTTAQDIALVVGILDNYPEDTDQIIQSAAEKVGKVTGPAGKVSPHVRGASEVADKLIKMYEWLTPWTEDGRNRSFRRTALDMLKSSYQDTDGTPEKKPKEVVNHTFCYTADCAP